MFNVKLLYMLLISLFFHVVLPAYEYQLSICAIFQNEARFLKEWIDFHKKQGIEHFWLYNNLSQDDYLSVLQTYVDNGTVDLIDWPYPNDDDSTKWHWIQCNAYNDAIIQMQNRVKWCAFIDTDEFLFSPKEDLKEVLDDYDQYSGVVINWVMYGNIIC